MAQDPYIQLDSLPEEVRKKVLDFIEQLMEQWEKGKKMPEDAFGRNGAQSAC